jgi:phosphonoacetaldehyde hydrolase
MPAQIKSIQRFGELIDGAATSFAFLRERGIAVATNTGYFRAAAQRVLDCARQQGLVPDHAVCSDDVSVGRPAPFMVYACMEALKVFRAREVRWWATRQRTSRLQPMAAARASASQAPAIRLG